MPRGGGYDAYPAFSSDGHRLAYSSCEKEVTPPCDVFVIDLGSDLQPTGQARQLTRMRVPIHGIAWAPDERSIVFALSTMSVYGTGMGAQLWRVGVEGNTPAERIDAAPWGSFAPSVNRSRIRLVFAQDHSDIDILRFEGGNPAIPVVSSSLRDYAPSFSPDGSRIAFESSRSGLTQEIWVSDSDGSNAVQITRPPHVKGNPSWGPNRLIVYSDLGDEDTAPDLFIMNADGTDRRQLTHDPLLEAVPTWSHDGHWVYYRQDGPDGKQIFRVSVDDGTKERLTKNGGLYPMVSWDSKTLVFTKTEGPTALYSMPAAGGDEQRIVDCVHGRSLAVTQPNNL
jgi:Tol biopolymer transport system component